MRKYYVLGLALVAVCAVGIVSAAGASALTFLLAEWLENGAGITATLLIQITEERLIIIILDGMVFHYTCSAILDGFAGPNGADEITETLTLGGEAISQTGLTGTALTCTNNENCGEPLSWELGRELTRLVLIEDGTETFFGDLVTSETTGGEIGFEFECMSLGLSDTCKTAEAVELVENTAEGLNLEASAAFTELAGLKLFNCATAGTEKGSVEGLGIMTSSGAGTLTASE
jgi:hypothetical protein